MNLQERRLRRRHFFWEDIISEPELAEAYMHKKVIGGTSMQNTLDRAVNSRIPFGELFAVDFSSPVPFLIDGKWCQSFIPEHKETSSIGLLTESEHAFKAEKLLTEVIADHGFNETQGTMDIDGEETPFYWGKDTLQDYVLILMEPADSYTCYTLIGCNRVGDSFANADCSKVLL